MFEILDHLAVPQSHIYMASLPCVFGDGCRDVVYLGTVFHTGRKHIAFPLCEKSCDS